MIENKKERNEITNKLDGKKIPDFGQEVGDLGNIFTKENTQKVLWKILTQDIGRKAREDLVKKMNNFLSQNEIKSNTVNRIHSLLLDWATEERQKPNNEKSQPEHKPKIADIFIGLKYE